MKARVEGIRALGLQADHAHRTWRRALAGKDDGQGAATTRARSTCSRRSSRPTLRPGLPGRDDRDPDLRRRRLPQGPPGRAVLPRLEDLLDLRGHQPHPGAGPGRPQAGPARRQAGARLPGRRRHASSRTTPSTRCSAPAVAELAQGAGGRSAQVLGKLMEWGQAGEDRAAAARRQPLPRDDGRARRRPGCCSRARSSPTRSWRETGGATRTRRSTRASATRRCTSRSTSCPASATRPRSSRLADRSPLEIPDEAFATL